jgi:hypothetical protein
MFAGDGSDRRWTLYRQANDFAVKRRSGMLDDSQAFSLWFLNNLEFREFWIWVLEQYGSEAPILASPDRTVDAYLATLRPTPPVPAVIPPMRRSALMPDAVIPASSPDYRALQARIEKLEREKANSADSGDYGWVGWLIAGFLVLVLLGGGAGGAASYFDEDDIPAAPAYQAPAPRIEWPTYNAPSSNDPFENLLGEDEDEMTPDEICQALGYSRKALLESGCR